MYVYCQFKQNLLEQPLLLGLGERPLTREEMFVADQVASGSTSADKDEVVEAMDSSARCQIHVHVQNNDENETIIRDQEDPSASADRDEVLEAADLVRVPRALSRGEGLASLDI